MTKFTSQLYGFLKRNLKLKYRNKMQTLPEIYNPVTILAILILFSFLFKSENLPATEYKPEYLGSNALVKILIYPDNNNTQFIGDLVKKNGLFSFNAIKYFNSTDYMKKFYLNQSDLQVYDYIGIEFSDTNFPYLYKLYTKWDDALFNYKSAKLTADGRVCQINTTDFLNVYENCAGNKLVYNGLSYIQSVLDASIKSVSRIK